MAEWVTLFDGEVTTETEKGERTGGYKNQDALHEVTMKPFFASGDKVRLTVDGVSFIYTAKSPTTTITNWFNYEKCGFAGNEYLTALDVADNGGDYCVFMGFSSIGSAVLSFYSRNPGTYNIKIERPHPRRLCAGGGTQVFYGWVAMWQESS